MPGRKGLYSLGGLQDWTISIGRIEYKRQRRSYLLGAFSSFATTVSYSP